MKIFSRSRTSAETPVRAKKSGSGLFRLGGSKKNVTEEKRIEERKDDEIAKEQAATNPAVDERDPAEAGLKTPKSETTMEGIEKQMEEAPHKPKRMMMFRKAREARQKKVEEFKVKKFRKAAQSKKFRKAAPTPAAVVQQEAARAKEGEKAADAPVEEIPEKAEADDALKENDDKEEAAAAPAMADVAVTPRSNEEPIDSQPSPMDVDHDETGRGDEDERLETEAGSAKSMDTELDNKETRDLSEEPQARTGLFCGCI